MGYKIEEEEAHIKQNGMLCSVVQRVKKRLNRQSSISDSDMCTHAGLLCTVAALKGWEGEIWCYQCVGKWYGNCNL